MRMMGATAAAGAVAGTATLAWAVLEARRYTLRHAVVPALPAGSAPLRILHLSDLHMTPDLDDRADWVGRLDEWAPDLVLVTGDFLAAPRAVPIALRAVRPLLDRPGAFVLGSNDYFAPERRNPLRYLMGPSAPPAELVPLPTGDLVAGLRQAGWLDLSNRRGRLLIAGLDIDLRGVDDPHIGLDRYGEVAGPYRPEADLRIGVTHAPYLRILDGLDRDGTDLIVAGHTHGGQVCLPGGRAIVTNCDLDPRRAKGLSQHREGQRHAGDRSDGAWLHVSAGLGTSPAYPIRLFCRPEATLLELVAREDRGLGGSIALGYTDHG